MSHRFTRLRAGVLALLLTAVTPVGAHCDSLSGPVALDATRALASGRAEPALKWVAPAQEAEARAAFTQALAVRRLGGEARQLADRHFLETLVRLHRLGEGEAFTGLKPADSTDPGLAAADAALARGNVTDLAEDLADQVRNGLAQRFALAAERRRHADDSLAAGRAYVEAYVEYVHFVERTHQLMTQGAAHQHP